MGRGSHLFLFSPSSVQVVVLNSVSHQSKCSAMSSIYVTISCINWKSGSSSTKHNGSVTFLPSLFSVRWSVVDKICCAFSLSLNRAEKKYRIKSYFALSIIAWFISLIYTHIYKSTCFLVHHILFTTSIFHPFQNKLFWVKKVNGDFFHRNERNSLHCIDWVSCYPRSAILSTKCLGFNWSTCN